MKVGDHVTITESYWKNLSGVITRLEPDNRVAVTVITGSGTLRIIVKTSDLRMIESREEMEKSLEFSK